MSLFFEYPIPRKSLVMSPKKKHSRSSHAWHGFFCMVKIGDPLFVSRARVYLKINPFVTVLGQCRKVINTLIYFTLGLTESHATSSPFLLLNACSQPLTDWVHERKIAGIWYRSEEIDIQFREYQSCGILTQPISLKTVRLSVIGLSASVNIDLNFNSLHRKTSGCQGWRRSITYRFESLTIDRIYS